VHAETCGNICMLRVLDGTVFTMVYFFFLFFEWTVSMNIYYRARVDSRDEHRIMLDTCIGSDRKREFDIFTNMRATPERPRARGLPAGGHRLVLCTHLHSITSVRDEHGCRLAQQPAGKK